MKYDGANMNLEEAYMKTEEAYMQCDESNMIISFAYVKRRKANMIIQ